MLIPERAGILQSENVTALMVTFAWCSICIFSRLPAPVTSLRDRGIEQEVRDRCPRGSDFLKPSSFKGYSPATDLRVYLAVKHEKNESKVSS